MRGTVYWRVLGGFLVAGNLFSQGVAAPIPINNWFAISSIPEAVLVGGDTASPKYQEIGRRGFGQFFSYFDPVTLADGQKLTVNFGLTLDIDAPDLRFAEFRMGLFKSSDLRADADSDAHRITRDESVVEGWSGFLLILPNRPGALKPTMIYRRKLEDGTNYTTKSGLDLRSAFSQPGPQPVFRNGEEKMFSLVLEREGNNLLATLLYDEGSFSGLLAGAFGDGYEARFDSLGLYATESDAVINSLSVNNALLTHNSGE